VSLRDFLSNLGPMLVLKIPFLGRVFGKPRVEVDRFEPPFDAMVQRMREADGKQDEVER
jgi:hypothetical protein